MKDPENAYEVEEVRDAREVSPFDDYVEESEDSGHRGHVVFSCPSCDQSIPAPDLVLEGGGRCPGCEREVQLHITSRDRFGEWRNVPERLKEMFA